MIEKIESSGKCISTRQARKYLLHKFTHKCAICGRKSWEGEEIPLIADHIDGNPRNHSLDNLRLICPNCDALLPTYKGRNYGNGRYLRRKRYKEDKSY